MKPFWKERSDPAAQAALMRELFLNVFSTPEGMQVLGVILEDLFYWKPALDPESVALNQYAKFLLRERLGANNQLALVESLIAMAKE